MEKITPQTKDITSQNIHQIAQLFPQVITEKEDKNGNTVKAIDFELLKQHLSPDLVEDTDERYRLDWPGKRASILKANTPITSTLKPDRGSSVNFDTTENVYIEGDNFEVLKILQESYLGKIKMIYIDPPYNTGNDFVYKDHFKVSKDDYETKIGTEDEEGGKLFKNTDTNGRFHSDWLSMINERLLIARDLLTEDGVVFISIDDNEVHNLRKISDEIFGEENFVAQFVWEKKKKGAFLAGDVVSIKEYIVVYVKNKATFNGLIGEIARQTETYPVIKTTNTRGKRIIKKGIKSKFKESNHKVNKGTRISSGNMEMILLSDMIIEGGILKEDLIVDSNWIYSQNLLDEFVDKNLLYITQDLYFRRIVSDPREKKMKDILQRVGTDNLSGDKFIINDNLFADGWGTNEDGNNELHQLLGLQNLFDFPKPSKLISKISHSIKDKEMLVLDFFSGSATTAHAILELNAQDGGNRKFIMVQIPEETDEKSEAFKAGYKTIPEIGKERIRRAGKKILEENSEKLKERKTPLDVGFRVYKTADSVLKDVAKHPNEVTQTNLFKDEDNIKEDATSEDILTSVILDFGLTLDNAIATKQIAGSKIFMVDDNALVACFNTAIDMQVVEEMVKMQPLRAVFRDACFKDDKDLINTVESRFKQLAPNTKVHVI